MNNFNRDIGRHYEEMAGFEEEGSIYSDGNYYERRGSFDEFDNFSDASSTQRQGMYAAQVESYQNRLETEFLESLNRDGITAKTVKEYLNEIIEMEETEEIKFDAVFESEEILERVLEIDWTLFELYGIIFNKYNHINDNTIFKLVEVHGEEVIEYLNESETFQFVAVFDDKDQLETWAEIVKE